MCEVLPYTSNKQLQNEIKIISFTIAQTMKYLRIILSKYMPKLYTESYKTLLREINENKINVEKYHVHDSKP